MIAADFILSVTDVIELVTDCMLSVTDDKVTDVILTVTCCSDSDRCYTVCNICYTDS